MTVVDAKVDPVVLVEPDDGDELVVTDCACSGGGGCVGDGSTAGSLAISS